MQNLHCLVDCLLEANYGLPSKAIYQASRACHSGVVKPSELKDRAKVGAGGHTEEELRESFGWDVGLKINSVSKSRWALADALFSHSPVGSVQFIQSNSRVKSCKGPSHLAEEDLGHGIRGMLEAGGQARPIVQACCHVQSSVDSSGDSGGL